MKLSLIAIHHPGDPAHKLLINQGDFDPAVHKEWSEANAQGNVQTQEQTETPPPAALAPSRAEREAELMAMYYGADGDGANWRPIKAIADGYGIAKPEPGWDEAIPLILEVEYPG